MPNRTGSGLHFSDLLEILRIDRLTSIIKKPKILDFFHALFKKLWDKETKKVFVLFQLFKN